MVVNVIMKRYFTGAIKYGLFFFFLLSSAHSFVQETGEEQVLQFECTAINIGTLSEDDAPVTYHFKYCNVSKKTVRISKLTTSCGCTVAKCNKDLVQPGERGEINLVFHPKDQAGDLYREAFVYTDLSGKKPMIRLVLTGKVSPTSDQWKGYPVAIGNTLRLKRKEWQIRVLSREGMQVERFICVNTGKQPLNLSALMLPEYIRFRTEPKVILPETEADMILSIDRSLLPQKNEITFCLVLDGISVRPSERTVQVRLLLQ